MRRIQTHHVVKLACGVVVTTAAYVLYTNAMRRQHSNADVRIEEMAARSPYSSILHESLVFPGVPCLLVDDKRVIDGAIFGQFWGELMEDVSRFPIVGLDCEWVGDNPIALIQVATSKRCVMFRSTCFDTIPAFQRTSSSGPAQTAENATTGDGAAEGEENSEKKEKQRATAWRLPSCLYELLMSKTIVKAGVGIHGDRKRIKRDCQFTVEHTFELAPAAIMLQALSGNKHGLGEVTKQVLGVELGKDQTVTVSNWEAETLSLVQRHYAADDAIASCRLLHALYDRRNDVEPPLVDSGLSVVEWTAAMTERRKTFKFPKQSMQSDGRKNSKKASRGDDSADLRSGKERREEAVSTRHCQVINQEGHVIYTCDQSKAIWYTRKKGLADVLELDEKTGRLLSIKLKFKTRSKTKICMNWQLGRCGVEHCPFAHGVHEIKVQPKHSEVMAARRQMAKAGNPSGEDDGADDDEMDEEDDFIDDYEEAAAAIHIPDLTAENSCRICMAMGRLYSHRFVPLLFQNIERFAKSGNVADLVAHRKPRSVTRLSAKQDAIECEPPASPIDDLVGEDIDDDEAVPRKPIDTAVECYVCCQCVPRVKTTYDVEMAKLMKVHNCDDCGAKIMNLSEGSYAIRIVRQLTNKGFIDALPPGREQELHLALIDRLGPCFPGQVVSSADFDSDFLHAILEESNRDLRDKFVAAKVEDHIISLIGLKTTEPTEGEENAAPPEFVLEDLDEKRVSAAHAEAQQFIQHWFDLFEQHFPLENRGAALIPREER